MTKYKIEEFSSCRGELELDNGYVIESENDIEYVLRQVYLKHVTDAILNGIEDRDDVEGDWEEDLSYVNDITYGREEGKYYVRTSEETWTEVRQMNNFK